MGDLLIMARDGGQFTKYNDKCNELLRELDTQSFASRKSTRRKGDQPLISGSFSSSKGRKLADKPQSDLADDPIVDSQVVHPPVESVSEQTPVGMTLADAIEKIADIDARRVKQAKKLEDKIHAEQVLIIEMRKVVNGQEKEIEELKSTIQRMSKEMEELKASRKDDRKASSVAPKMKNAEKKPDGEAENLPSTNEAGNDKDQPVVKRTWSEVVRNKINKNAEKIVEKLDYVSLEGIPKATEALKFLTRKIPRNFAVAREKTVNNRKLSAVYVKGFTRGPLGEFRRNLQPLKFQTSRIKHISFLGTSFSEFVLESGYVERFKSTIQEIGLEVVTDFNAAGDLCDGVDNAKVNRDRENFNRRVSRILEGLKKDEESTRKNENVIEFYSKWMSSISLPKPTGSIGPKIHLHYSEEDGDAAVASNNIAKSSIADLELDRESDSGSTTEEIEFDDEISVGRRSPSVIYSADYDSQRLVNTQEGNASKLEVGVAILGASPNSN
jgi:hypothetical protein